MNSSSSGLIRQKLPGFGQPILVATKLLLETTKNCKQQCIDHVEQESYDHPCINNKILIAGGIFSKLTQDHEGWGKIGKEFVDSMGYAMHNIVNENGEFSKEDQEHLKDTQSQIYSVISNDISSPNELNNLKKVWSEYCNDLINTSIVIGKKKSKNIIMSQYNNTIKSSLNFAQYLNNIHITTNSSGLYDAKIASNMNTIQLYNSQAFVGAPNFLKKGVRKLGKITKGAYRTVSRRARSRSKSKAHKLSFGTRQFRGERGAISVPWSENHIVKDDYLLIVTKKYNVAPESASKTLKIRSRASISINIETDSRTKKLFYQSGGKNNDVITANKAEDFPLALLYLSKIKSSKTNAREVLGEFFEWNFVEDKKTFFTGATNQNLTVMIEFYTSAIDYQNLDFPGYQETIISTLNLGKLKPDIVSRLSRFRKSSLSSSSSNTKTDERKSNVAEFVMFDDDSRAFARLLISARRTDQSNLPLADQYEYSLLRLRIFFPHTQTASKQQF